MHPSAVISAGVGAGADSGLTVMYTVAAMSVFTAMMALVSVVAATAG